MNSLLIYLSGVLTPFLLMLAFVALQNIGYRRSRRRYQRAWDRFGAEFDNLTPAQLDYFRAKWADQSDSFGSYCDDRSRYFADRWKNGYTTEI